MCYAFCSLCTVLPWTTDIVLAYLMASDNFAIQNQLFIIFFTLTGVSTIYKEKWLGTRNFCETLLFYYRVREIGFVIFVIMLIIIIIP